MDFIAKEVAHSVIKMLDENKSFDVKLYGGRGICDGMIAASADSRRQAKSLADRLIKFFKEKGVKFRMEGYDSGGWILIDANNLLVHVFKDDVRSYYQIDCLWSNDELWI